MFFFSFSFISESFTYLAVSSFISPNKDSNFITPPSLVLNGFPSFPFIVPIPINSNFIFLSTKFDLYDVLNTCSKYIPCLLSTMYHISSGLNLFFLDNIVASSLVAYKVVPSVLITTNGGISALSVSNFTSHTRAPWLSFKQLFFFKISNISSMYGYESVSPSHRSKLVFNCLYIFFIFLIDISFTIFHKATYDFFPLSSSAVILRTSSIISSFSFAFVLANG